MQMTVHVTATMGVSPMSGATGALAGLALYGLKRVPVDVEIVPKGSSSVAAAR